jgi:hypothetical protein
MNHQNALVTAISLTDEILMALDADDLERLTDLEAQREPLIRQAFEQSIQQVDQIKAIHLKNLNQKVIEKLMTFKQSIKQEKQQLSRSAKATRAYQANQR